MVCKTEYRGTTAYRCECSGFGYKHLETAEDCEQHCGSKGLASREITAKAVYSLEVRVIAIASSRFIKPTTHGSRLRHSNRRFSRTHQCILTPPNKL